MPRPKCLSSASVDNLGQNPIFKPQRTALLQAAPSLYYTAYSPAPATISPITFSIPAPPTIVKPRIPPKRPFSGPQDHPDLVSIIMLLHPAYRTCADRRWEPAHTPEMISSPAQVRAIVEATFGSAGINDGQPAVEASMGSPALSEAHASDGWWRCVILADFDSWR
jgi:hypothetical protein